MWEFPGGKVDPGESLGEALARELAEELQVQVAAIGEHLCSVSDPNSVFQIHFIEVDIIGEPHPLEHEQMGWVFSQDALALPLAPSDRCCVEYLAAGGSSPVT